jgi:hypothetical protein
LTLPVSLRNWLAKLILDAFGNAESRRVLGELSRFCSEPNGRVASGAGDAGFPPEFFEERSGTVAWRDGFARYRDELRDRAGRALGLLSARPLSPRESSLAQAFDEAALLFDAGFFFEVHELLEPWWIRTAGEEREVLQGLIQVAAGFHHLANGRVRGAVSLLDEGSLKLVGRTIGGRKVGALGLEARRVLQNIEQSPGEVERGYDWSTPPRFPREA